MWILIGVFLIHITKFIYKRVVLVYIARKHENICVIMHSAPNFSLFRNEKLRG